jgi:hypothetical protein
MRTDFKELATAAPGEFLYEVYREGPFANLRVDLVWQSRHHRLPRTWAVDPARDGLRAMFGVNASNERRSLRRALNEFRKATMNRWVKQVDRTTASGRVVKIDEVDIEALTPASLLTEITQIILLEKALAARSERQSKRIAEDMNFCENDIVPLLKAMPPNKSAAQYATFSA